MEKYTPISKTIASINDAINNINKALQIDTPNGLQSNLHQEKSRLVGIKNLLIEMLPDEKKCIVKAASFTDPINRVIVDGEEYFKNNYKQYEE